jgi:hypothetical protein
LCFLCINIDFQLMRTRKRSTRNCWVDFSHVGRLFCGGGRGAGGVVLCAKKVWCDAGSVCRVGRDLLDGAGCGKLRQPWSTLASRVLGPLGPDFWCNLLDRGVGSRSSESAGDALRGAECKPSLVRVPTRCLRHCRGAFLVP